MDFRNNNKNTKWWVPTKKYIPDTLLVALLTGVGYLATYAYQYSYLKYFNIPNFLIDINLGLVLFTTSVGLIWLLIMGMVLNQFSGLEPKGKGKFSKIVYKFVGLFSVLFIVITFPIVAIIYDPTNPWAVVTLMLIALIVLGIRSYEKQGLLDNTGREINENSLLSKIEQIYGSFPILFLEILLLLIAYSGTMGTIIAQGKTDYFVTNTNPKLIIISTYSDGFLGLTFDTSTLKFDKNINLLSKDKIYKNSFIFSIEKIGRLTSN